jgi:hypothetical protein
MSETEHDHALVVGISRYAAADHDPPWLPNLRGPDNDAEAIGGWLMRGDGGGLPPQNVCVIRSADFPNPTNIGPQQQAVIDAFTKLKDLPTNAFEGQYAGRRLYVYAAGHGMANNRDDAALVTAEATRDDRLNVLVNDWFDWFWYARRFREFVLWIDTCATLQPAGFLKPCPWDRENHIDAGRGDLFMAFGAEYGKIAVENQFDGKWHGVFSYALVQALNGANGNPVGSENLKNYLYNSLRTFLTEAQLNHSGVAKEPAFGTTDQLVFAARARPTFSVTLVFPQDCVGKEATVSTVDRVIHETTLAARNWTVDDLEAGGYAAYVPELDRRYGFGVTGGVDEVVITLQ